MAEAEADVPTAAAPTAAAPTAAAPTAAAPALSVRQGKRGPDGVELNFSLTPPSGGERQPSDIVCIIDISGSMGMEATIVGAGGTSESHGLSLLDVAKHGVRTIANALGDKDRLAVVIFSHWSDVLFDLRYMDAAGKAYAEEKLDTLSSGGGTNIWEGLKNGLECLKTGKTEKGRFGHVMLLTDGESQGRDMIIPNLNSFRDTDEGLPGSINTFGFGYNLDSKLLVELAKAGGGSYSFIPDAGFVGTAFVNMLSMLLSTLAQEVTLTVDGGDSKVEIRGGWQLEKKGDFDSVALGSLQFGQSRDVVLTVNAPETEEIVVSGRYKDINGEAKELESVKAEVKEGEAKEQVSVEEQRSRCLFVDIIQEILKEMQQHPREHEQALARCAERLKAAGDEITAGPAGETDYIKALLEDLCGQSSEAVSRWDWYNKWGVHYLPSVMFAHRLQICNNFKDPGVQSYGGDLFQKLRDDADDIFCSLPAPKPTARSYNVRSYGGGAVAAAPVSMAAYHDSSAVCVDGSCLVQLPDGSHRPLASLEKGDRIASGDGIAELACLVRSPCKDGRALLVELPGGLRLTPYHPVLVDGAWRFPCELAQAKELPCEAVYSFALVGAPALCVAGIACAALGHGLEAGAAAHPFFASKKVLEEIAAMKGYSEGLVELLPGSVRRDPETGLVSGLLP